MPEEDGFSFIRRLHQIVEFRSQKIPVLALTAYAAPEEVERILEAGFDAHLAKPVDIGKLIDVILKLIKQKSG